MPPYHRSLTVVAGQRTKRTPAPGVAVMFGLGAVFLMIFLWLTLTDIFLLRSGVEVDGRVIGNQASAASDSGQTWQAVIGYVDQNGGRHQVLAEPTKDQAPVGAVHRVGYDPGNPDRGA